LHAAALRARAQAQVLRRSPALREGQSRLAKKGRRRGDFRTSEAARTKSAPRKWQCAFYRVLTSRHPAAVQLYLSSRKHIIEHHHLPHESKRQLM
jgi:hypothetical protein